MPAGQGQNTLAYGESANPLWLDGAGGPTRQAASGELEFEVAVVGAGFTGLHVAYRLASAGVRVAVLEAARIGSGVSGHTTAKLSALQQITYSDVASRRSAEHAAAYAEGNVAAVEAVAEIVDRHGIKCDMRRRDATIFASTPEGLEDIAEEGEAASAAGLEVREGGEVPSGLGAIGAVSLGAQLELHPRKYLDGLAAAAEDAGAVIFEGSRVRTAGKAPGSPELRTDGATVKAERVVIATLMPILDRGVFFTRLTGKRSYSLAYPGVEDVGGMLISAEQPTTSIRSHQARGKGETLILGGAGNTLGMGDDPTGSYATLRRIAAEMLGVDGVPTHQWSAHDLESADGFPYAGRLLPFDSSVLFASGFRKWGLTNGVWCGEVLAAGILGGEHPHASLLTPNRINAASVPGIGREGLKSAKHMARWAKPRLKSAEELSPGEGGLVRLGKTPAPVGAYRTPSGELRKVVPACTHVGCPLEWNAADTSWDCPCHGSRFDTTGAVLQGPATRPLKRL